MCDGPQVLRRSVHLECLRPKLEGLGKQLSADKKVPGEKRFGRGQALGAPNAVGVGSDRDHEVHG